MEEATMPNLEDRLGERVSHGLDLGINILLSK